MRRFGSILQLVGLAVVAVGGGLLLPWVGVVLAGVALFAVGYQLESLHGGEG